MGGVRLRVRVVQCRSFPASLERQEECSEWSGTSYRDKNDIGKNVYMLKKKKIKTSMFLAVALVGVFLNNFTGNCGRKLQVSKPD